VIRIPQTAMAAVLSLMAGAAWAEPEMLVAEQPAAVSEETVKPASPEPLPVEPLSAPIQMMRTLQLLQDQIALGSTEAFAAQRGLLTILDGRFMDLDDATWKDERNVRAAIIFVLSGGKPQILRKILGLSVETVPVDARPVIEGALAYVEGREEEAKRSLMSIEIATLPPNFGAQIALVQSALIVRTEPTKAIELLDWVRLVAPGTLLEEGALRREVFVASQIGDVRKFELLVMRYLRQYRSSIYASNFRQRLASALTRIDFEKDPDRFTRVVAMLAELEPDVQRELFLLMARASVDQGNVKSAVLSAGKARELAANDRVSEARADLYAAAASVVNPAALEKSIQTLASLDRSILPPSDVALLDAARSLAQRIRLGPETSAKHEVKLDPEQAKKVTQVPDQLPAVVKAREALNRVDQLIKN